MNHEEENIAQTLARELPKPTAIGTIPGPDGSAAAQLFAIPKGMELKQIDVEPHRATPFMRTGTALFSDHNSFLEYVHRHADGAHTVVWCEFDQVTNKLAFTAVFDDHADDTPGWRKHRAYFEPAKSVEWTRWIGHDKKQMAQVDFAQFIEDNADDITGTPSSAEVYKMATEFIVRQDQAVKSIVRLQSGGVELNYVSNDDAQTIERMRMFEAFTIGIPVFRGSATAEALVAKLRYRNTQGKVTFWYELQRPDKAHRVAAEDMLKAVRDNLGGLPLLLGGMGKTTA
jgi:uncharacterized protein YfdQ (DUF2303 family)